MVAAFVVMAATSVSALAATANTWHVQVGSIGIGVTGPDGRFGNAFYPGSITAHAGDTVVFQAASPHTVTFNRPVAPLFAFFAPAGGNTLSTGHEFVNSGFLNPGDTFTLHLGASLPAGSYAFLCSLHLGMTGRIEVVPAEARLPRTDADNIALSARRIAADLERAADIAEGANERAEDSENTVLVGAGDHRVTNVRFFPASITIHAGESVRFLKTHDPTEPHTVSLGPGPGDPVAELLPAGGPPFTYDGNPATLVSTGILVTRRQYRYYHLDLVGFPPPTDRATITFTKPGTYDYVCFIHDDVGMKGRVVVLP